MKYKVVRWYDGIKNETFVPTIEMAYQEYNDRFNCDTIELYALSKRSEIPILLEKKNIKFYN